MKKLPSWAKHIQIVREGAKVQGISKTISIIEANRATQFVSHVEAFKIINKILTDNYHSKGVDAVIVGVNKPHGVQFAIYCEDHFLDQ